MSSTPRPHDLLWLNHASALEAIAEPWVAPAVASRAAGGGETRR